MARVRLQDVAERAGVSIRTVSNAVNGYTPVSEEKRRRIDKAVAELGYRPNIMARNLRRGRTGLIALVVPELDVPYFAELSRAIIEEAGRHGYTVVIDQTDGEPDRERQFIMNGKGTGLFDGIIFSPLALSQAEIAQRSGEIPLVLLGERVASGDDNHVVIDNVAAAREATEHLVSIGRRCIAAIGDQPYETGETAQLRTRGYREALAEAGMGVDEALIVPTRRFHFEDGAAAMEALLAAGVRRRPDAIFCYNDLLAIGAIRAILARGLRVPEDVAVVGFDDIEAGRYVVPSLTSVAPDKHQIASMAVQLLLAGINGEEQPVELVRHRLIVRESTGGRLA